MTFMHSEVSPRSEKPVPSVILPEPVAFIAVVAVIGAEGASRVFRTGCVKSLLVQLDADRSREDRLGCVSGQIPIPVFSDIDIDPLATTLEGTADG